MVATESEENADNEQIMRAPQLVFDDGSRVMMQTATSSTTTSIPSGRGEHVSVRNFYEINRLADEIRSFDNLRGSGSGADGWDVRVALQFPDELLADSPEVCWALQEALTPESLVFCLGDTTYAPCCPDHVAAAHLQADCIVHFGHACLSSSGDIPVLYSFGRQELLVDPCVEAVASQMQASTDVKRIIVLYEVQYARAMDELKASLSERKEEMEVHLARIPETSRPPGNSPGTISMLPSVMEEKECTNLVVGGLALPDEVNDFTRSAILFVGSDASRQYLNIILRFISTSDDILFWVWNPVEQVLSTTPSPVFQRKLNRRFYLIQKAMHCSVFGIVVANLSDSHMRRVVETLRRLLEKHGRVSYVLVVGKINPAKLANFAEIECFILVACPEHSLLENDREFPTPILTPLEITMSLGVTQWGSEAYSTDRLEFLDRVSAVDQSVSNDQDGNDDDDDDDDDDSPYFSLVSGRYESIPTRDTDETTDLSALPGKGQLTKYESAAADFLKQREYKGLEVQAGTSKVQAAVKGQVGIASNYGEK